jgi:hypothetical protein
VDSDKESTMDLSKLNIVDLILNSIKFDPSGLSNILEIAPNALADPNIINALTSYLESQGNSSNEVEN